MKKTVLFKVGLAASMILAISASGLAQTASLSNKEKAIAILKSLKTRDQQGPAYISDERYIQHNLIVADNKSGFLALQKWLPADNEVHIVRAFADGDYVFLHVGYHLGGPMAGMDIFRFKEGKAVELWDNLQLIPQPTNRSGHSMLDGATEIKDIPKTAANKKLVVQYMQTVFVGGHLDKLDAFIDSARYTAHHPGFSDGLTGLKNGIQEMLERRDTLHYTRIHLVLGEGNFCMVQGEGDISGKRVGIYDLFRIEDGKIVEHWDTIEEIPAKETWKNSNGKF